MPGEQEVWHYWSAILQADFWVALTERQATALRDTAHAAAYSAREVALLRPLKQRSPATFDDKLRTIHACKDVLGATIQAVELGHDKEVPHD